MYKPNDSKELFLNKIKDERHQRELFKTKNQSIIIIQALVRGFISRRKLKRQLKNEICEFLNIEIQGNDKEYKPILKPAFQLHDSIRRYFSLYEKDDFINFCLFKYIISSIHSDEYNLNYLSLSVSKVYLKTWLQQVRKLILICEEYLSSLKPQLVNDMKNISNCLHIIIIFTDSRKWATANKSSDAVNLTLNLFSRSFCIHLVSHDLYEHLQVLESINEHRIFNDIVVYFMDKNNREKTFAYLQGNTLLSFIGNFIELSSLTMKNSDVNFDHFKKVLIVMLRVCLPNNEDTKSTHTHWHPIFGWYHMGSKARFDDNNKKTTHLPMEPSYDKCDVSCDLGKSITYKTVNNKLVSRYKDLLNYNPERISPQRINKSLFNKLLKSNVVPPALLKLSSSVLASTCRSCEVYCYCILLFCQLKSEIISGITMNDRLLPCMWLMIGDLGAGDFGLEVLLEAFESKNRSIFNLLSLVCDTSSQILTIIDDIEFYERETVFNLSLLVKVCILLNKFTYHMICRINQDNKLKSNPTFMSVYSLLMTLYERDCRRSFLLANQWVLKEIKMSEFIREIEKNPNTKYKLVLHYIPHVIPLNQRLALLRGNIKLEKTTILSNSTTTLIRIRRPFLLEDGFRQLSSMTPQSLKQVIRVKFVNILGLDEVGIDQDGVFKEFLEETIKLVFNPSLNLFKTTESHKLYPSSTSHLQDDHLNLFEFVGKILAKAIYEGIVVDINFAKFFLTQMIGRYHHAIYSSIDELPSLDPDLYKNLTYIKKCNEEEIDSLDLSFSIDENYLGKIVTHSLVPGGQHIAVTNENKINYIHKMADFKMRTQIKSQTNAFVSGFRSLLQSDWLTMFSSDELQKLIAGDSNDLDLCDLRRHTQYYGGFHDNHRVINWLWSILEHDFKPEERSMFLKFVTSCSKPPLLGFVNMQPSFSIRCVDTSDDQDTGDTIGSVLKGFFSIRTNGKQAIGRLPTASTCFNLLKLPNYSKRSLLRDKLRYSIEHNCGFELS